MENGMQVKMLEYEQKLSCIRGKDRVCWSEHLTLWDEIKSNPLILEEAIKIESVDDKKQFVAPTICEAILLYQDEVPSDILYLLFDKIFSTEELARTMAGKSLSLGWTFMALSAEHKKNMWSLKRRVFIRREMNLFCYHKYCDYFRSYCREFRNLKYARECFLDGIRRELDLEKKQHHM